MNDERAAAEAEDELYAALRQRGQRDSMFLQANVRRAGGDVMAVRVRNISSGGVLIESSIAFTKGEAIAVELRGIGFVPGRIAWAAPGKCGVAFDHDIDPKATRKPLPNGPRAAPMGPMVVSLRRPGLRYD